MAGMSRRTSLVTVLVGVVLAATSMLFIWQAVAASPPSLGEPVVVTGTPTSSVSPSATSAATKEKKAEPVPPPTPQTGGGDDDDDDD